MYTTRIASHYILFVRCSLDRWMGALQRDELSRMVHQTEQQISILKASLERASKAKDHAEAQVRDPRTHLYQYVG